MRVVFVRNKNVSPAGYYRICQYLNENDELTISQYSINRYYHSKLPKKIKILLFGFIPGYFRRLFIIIKALKTKDDLSIFVQRRIFVKKTFLIDRILLKKLFENAKKIIWDFDDNIFDNNEITEFEANLLLKYATDIVVPNKFLADKVASSNAEIHFIPTTDIAFENLDLSAVNSIRRENYSNEIRLLWLGTHSNIKYLEKILPYLDKAAKLLKKDNKKLILRNVSDAKLDTNYHNLEVHNVKWAREIAIDEMRNNHIGLMPLELNSYTPGKSAFKAIQYMSAGMPTILSPVGYNREVISHEKNGFFAIESEDWVKYILKLSSDYDYWNDISIQSRKNWNENFNSKIIRNSYRKLLGIL